MYPLYNQTQTNSPISRAPMGYTHRKFGDGVQHPVAPSNLSTHQAPVCTKVLGFLVNCCTDPKALKSQRYILFSRGSSRNSRLWWKFTFNPPTCEKVPAIAKPPPSPTDGQSAHRCRVTWSCQKSFQIPAAAAGSSLGMKTLTPTSS